MRCAQLSPCYAVSLYIPGLIIAGWHGGKGLKLLFFIVTELILS